MTRTLAAGVLALTAGFGPVVLAASAQTAPSASPAVTPAAAAAAALPAVPGAAPFDPSDPWLWGDQAVLRGLDKVTAATRDFTAPVGQEVDFLGLTISVKRCAKRPPERQPEVIVGMEISDRQDVGQAASTETPRIFAGWMFGSSPALNPLEHPVYDVWVLDCINSLAPVVEPEPVPEDGPAAEDEEEPAAPLPGQVFD